MSPRLIAAAVVVTLAAGATWLAVRDPGTTPRERAILYYKDPMGGPETSPVPKKDSMGMDYLPVYADEAQKTQPRILYYRNPMGLPDTSPVPKKDTMGMDYIPVYENEIAAPGTVNIDTARVQRSGVRTAKAELRDITREIQAVGSVALDESRVATVTLRAEGYVERVHVGATGLTVKAGQALLDVYSPELAQLQEEYRLARESAGSSTGQAERTANALAESALKRLQNLGLTPAQIRAVAAGTFSRTIAVHAPISGIVTKKNALLGQRVMPGEDLYEIADIGNVWVVAKVFEHDLAALQMGSPVRITVSALPGRTFDGTVSFIAPQIDPETRTADVRINVGNPDGALRAAMYATVMLPGGRASQKVAVPNSAIIDSGARQVVLVAKGGGTFEPREITRGPAAGGYTAIEKGLTEGEEVVVDAAFLIDAESNLNAALGAFTGNPPPTQEPKQ